MAQGIGNYRAEKGNWSWKREIYPLDKEDTFCEAFNSSR